MKELILFLSVLLKFSVYSHQCVNDVNTQPDHQPLSYSRGFINYQYD